MADKPNKLAFLSMQAPAGYVAGLGRGASGFTTRADIGPARLPTSSTNPGKPYTSGAASENDDEVDDDGKDEEEEGRFQDPENETALFAGGVYEKDDEEADRIWESVDARMDLRRKKFREAREKEEREKERLEKPRIGAQFADLKRGLSSVTEDEWASLTESGSVTGKRRKAAAKREARNTRSFAISDTILVGNRDRNAVEASLTADQMDNAPGNDGGTISSLAEIGEARNKVLSHQLDSLSSSTTPGTATSIDPQGYLTELSSSVIKSNAEIGDIKKARTLLDSVIKTNPHHSPGWIAAARLEEHAGKMSTARRVIAQGCEQCPKAEDVWLESARLNTPENAKVILAQSVKHCSQSVNIWLKAVELESDPESKKRVLRKSLEYIPESVKLWKELVSLEENPEDARILLSGAVSAVPSSVELWLALARLSISNDAKKVLNEARKAIPTSHEIWIAAARLLEETEQEEVKVDKTIAAAVKALRKAGVELSRDQWLSEAERVEQDGSPMVCSAIVKATIEQDIEEEDKRSVWTLDAASALSRGCINTARSILTYTLQSFPDKPSIWMQAIELEQRHGTKESTAALLERAVSNCPNTEDLWLTYPALFAGFGDIAGARKVLIRAFDANIGSERISLAAAQLESDHGAKGAAGKLLERARVEVGSARVWLKSAVFERDHGSAAQALELVDEAINKFPDFDKLYMMGGQLKRTLAFDPAQGVKEAREYFSRGLRQCPHSSRLWVLASRLEEEANLVIRSRALLEKARLHNTTSESIWAESVSVEERSGSLPQAKTLLSRALQQLPTSGALWALAIAFEPRPGRKSKMTDALKKTGDDARVISVVAQQFWLEGKHQQARKWFMRSTEPNSGDWGDGWGMWYKFELMHGTEEEKKRVKVGVDKARPKHGEVWISVAKQVKNKGLISSEILEIVAQKMIPLK
ncbi:probable pre-mRNA splicing factor prp1 [Melanopsichium pennsylvanicum]|uniref:Probable pre-mRNA splicing factor prp1 n=2 Tax=Melanopsichium pennsylvanicum TaxID=63383 RepID=A0AAJ4XJL9_9BASI|nr:probable pre-mRNA splicing factor prp1 [Melanopsichium pennsylvanicum 4]SNX83572.1 probable pre-mRNA splicing factor prp1 [Melanopsichium pennsylvanicum]